MKTGQSNLIISFTPGMTGITGIAVIAVSGNIIMLVIHRTLAVLVTVNTFKPGIIPGIDVTIRATVPFVPVFARIYREIQIVMIPVGRCPACGRMTGLTSCREVGRRMIGIGCLIVIGCVTGITVCGCVCISRCMTSQTIQNYMGACQGKCCHVMVKSSRAPCHGGMALGAVMAEAVEAVIGIGGSRVIVLVAGIAVGCRSGVPILMAVDAVDSCMGACQGEGRHVMIEGGRTPR